MLKTSRLNLPITESDQLPPNHKPFTQLERKNASEKTKRVVDWLIKYESWIERICGENWRKQCLDDWGKATLGPKEIKPEWENLQKQLELIYTK